MLHRNLKVSDYDFIISVVNEWWGGRDMADMLPRLFFKYFNDTSFVFVDGNKVIAFIIGFISQVSPNQAYVHFTGVNPDYRKKGLGKKLYQIFFEAVQRKGCDTVSLVTSPVNKNSIVFHRHIGFKVRKENNIVDNVVHTNYDGPGEDRIIFEKSI